MTTLEECLAGYREWLVKEKKAAKKTKTVRSTLWLGLEAGYSQAMEKAIERFDSEVLSKLKEVEK